MEIALFALLILFAVLVPLFGKDSRESGDWTRPPESRRSPSTRRPDRSTAPKPPSDKGTRLLVGRPKHGH